MELDVAMRTRSAKRQGEEKLWRDTLKHKRRIICKPKPNVKRGVANQHTPIGTDLAQFGKTALHQRPANATALQVRFDRNGAKPIPASGTITDGHRRERHMPHDAPCIFGDKRD